MDVERLVDVGCREVKPTTGCGGYDPGWIVRGLPHQALDSMNVRKLLMVGHASILLALYGGLCFAPRRLGLPFANIVGLCCEGNNRNQSIQG